MEDPMLARLALLKVVSHVKSGQFKLHMNTIIMKLGNTTTAEAPVVTQKSGATPLILGQNGNIAMFLSVSPSLKVKL